MNALFGQFLRKDITGDYERKSQAWKISEYDERVLDYYKINHGHYIVKLKDDDGMQDEVEKINTLPLQLAAFILSKAKELWINFLHAIGGFYTNAVYYTDTDSLYIESKQWESLDRAGLIVKNLLQGKNDYKDGGFWYGLFLAPKIKYCLTINKTGDKDEHKTFKGFTNVSDILDRKEYFNMLDGGKLIAKVPLSWKKSLCSISTKMRNCTDCKKDFLCEKCDKLVNQKK